MKKDILTFTLIFNMKNGFHHRYFTVDCVDCGKKEKKKKEKIMSPGVINLFCLIIFVSCMVQLRGAGNSERI